MRKKDLEEQLKQSMDEADYWYDSYIGIIEENHNLHEENGVLDSEFEILVEENIMLKETLAAIFDCDEEWLTLTFERLKKRWTDE